MADKFVVHGTQIKGRFSDVDSMGIVWHGNYLKYLEDGREDFGIRYGISYLDFYNHAVLIPLVKVLCEYKKPLVYGDIATVETRFVNSDAAKIQYDYTIFRGDTDEVIATGMTLQVFVNMEKELLLDQPAFFLEWKKKYNLTD